MFSRTAKRRMLAVVAVLAAVFVVAVVKARLIGQKPFRSWEKADIAQVELTLTPPDQSFVLTDAEVGELLPLLQKVVLYQSDNSYTDYSGQAVVFDVTLRDGSTTQVVAYNPFVIIDGVGYRTKYEPCEVLNAFANRLLSERN